MASFAVFAVDDGSVAAAAAGLMNATAPAAAAAAGAVHRAAHVSARVFMGMRITGNLVSMVALLIPA
jgi:hypothetical protein